jgi:hypothetical protein
MGIAFFDFLSLAKTIYRIQFQAKSLKKILIMLLAVITFVLTQNQFAALQQGDHITVQYGSGGASWNFGTVDKTMLNQ